MVWQAPTLEPTMQNMPDVSQDQVLVFNADLLSAH